MTHGRPVIFGEVLFDCFPDGQAVLGGAPFNVAWHLQQFSCAPLMISSVGNDEHGDRVRSTMLEKGMDISGIQISDHFPTGQVVVKIEDGQPSYDIVEDQAYDHIDTIPALNALPDQPPALVYHGSLALRSTASKDALDSLLQKTNAPVFLDLNLREPWWELPLVEHILRRATWVKLNDEELCEVVRQPASDGPELKVYAKEVFDECQLKRLIVTRGAQGAFVLSEDSIVEGRPTKVKNIVDTVGAGDAFSAVTIAGLLQARPIDETLDKALKYAARICQQQGATA
jgi:fructokinase